MAEIHDVQDGESPNLNYSQATHKFFKYFGYIFLTLVLDRHPRSSGEILPRCGHRLSRDEEWRVPGRRRRDGAGWGEYVHLY
jgi:hypothetical protein